MTVVNFMDEALPNQFWAKCVPVPFSGCWLWTGAATKQGYGRMYRRTPGSWLAHIQAYEIIVGLIPKNLELDHLCRVTHCVNPAHLEAVTHQVNMLRGATIFAQQIARVDADGATCPHGHPYPESLRTFKGKRQCWPCTQVRNRTQNARRRKKGS